MSREHAVGSGEGSATHGSEGPGTRGERTAINSLLRGTARSTVVSRAGIGAAAFVGFAAGVRVLENLPHEPVVLPGTVEMIAGVGAPLAVGLALVAIGAVSGEPSVRVGALFAGVFAPMAAFDPAASLAAVGAVTVGGGMALLGAIGRPDTDDELARGAVALAFVAAVAGSLAASAAVVDGGYRPTAGALALLAIGAIAWLVRDDRVALLAGVVAALGFLTLTSASPFAVGGTLIAVFAATGTPTLLVALAVGGGIAGASAGIARHDWTLVAGATLLVLAGMPTTAPRAAAVLLGAMLVLAGPGRLLEPNAQRATNGSGVDG